MCIRDSFGGVPTGAFTADQVQAYARLAISTLTAERDALRAEVGAMRDDARRWRALRECLLGVDWAYQDDPDCSVAIFTCPQGVSAFAGPECADEIADAIDAASQKEQQ